jgi:hypothetical protein
MRRKRNDAPKARPKAELERGQIKEERELDRTR